WGTGYAPPPPPPKGRSRAVVVAAVVVTLGLIAAGAWFVSTRDSDPEFPSEWDPKVAELAAWVAKDRGLDFKHPVEVLFLSAEEYTEASSSGGSVEEGEVDEEAEEAIEQQLG